jgi:hypothetical protein
MPYSRILVVGALFVFLFAGIYFYPALSYLLDSQCWSGQNPSHDAIAHYAQFELPATFNAVNVTKEAGSSWCAMAVKFEMHPRDLTQFSASTNVGNLSSNAVVDWGDLPHERLAKRVGWRKQAVKSYLFGASTSDYFNQQYVFVDTSNPDNFVVYLVTEVGFLD